MSTPETTRTSAVDLSREKVGGSKEPQEVVREGALSEELKTRVGQYITVYPKEKQFDPSLLDYKTRGILLGVYHGEEKGTVLAIQSQKGNNQIFWPVVELLTFEFSGAPKEQRS